ncbi:MFS transporter [Ciceribacter lividus]|uniref:MFS transporter n=1 Tax=Ciceribacter lividus TaxID=1197950 RepID=A0A6I7HIB5_9HYPH|nr:MFS transporter [Ciceribacter lividus]RCW21471.1 MFS transporter [Ciceribacter lividus]
MTVHEREITELTPAVAESDGGRWLDLLAPRYLVATAMLCLGVALYAFNGFLVSTVMPTTVAELGGEAVISWSLTLFLTASIIAGTSAAMLKERFGARLVLTAAALVFLAGTLLAATATTMAAVLLGRIGQGLGEGVVAAICYALIPEIFPPRLVPKVFGAEALVWALAAFGGPVLAGYLTETISWRAAFFVNVPIIAIFVLMAVTIVPNRQGREVRSTAFPGLRLALLATALVTVLVAGLSGALPQAAVALVVAVLALAGSLHLDRRAKETVLPAGAFSLGSALGLGLWAVLLMSLAQATSSVYLVFSLQNLWHFPPTAAGGMSALMAICWSLTAIGVANLRSDSRKRSMIWIGPLLLVGGLGLLVASLLSGKIALLVVAQVAIGAAFGVSWGYLSQMLMDTAPAHERDKTSTLLPTLQSAGYALGGALAGLTANAAGLAAAKGAEDLRGPLATAFVLAFLWSLPAALVSWRAVRLLRNPRGNAR